MNSLKSYSMTFDEVKAALVAIRDEYREREQLEEIEEGEQVQEEGPTMDDYSYFVGGE